MFYSFIKSFPVTTEPVATRSQGMVGGEVVTKKLLPDNCHQLQSGSLYRITAINHNQGHPHGLFQNSNVADFCCW
jgi:hypothetical protein